MKPFSLTIIILIVSMSIRAQIKSNYSKGFEVGFKEGYCYNNGRTYDCLAPITPLTPLPRINEHQDNYTDGYNRGFQYGLDLKRSNDALENADINLNQRIVKFNEYISQGPLIEARVRVGMYKQKMYDLRKDWIQQRINGLAELVKTLFNEQTLPQNVDVNKIKSAAWKNATDYIKAIAGYDFANDYQFSSIQTNFNKIEKYFYDTYNSVISSLEIENQNSASSFANPSEKTSLENSSSFSSKESYFGVVSVNTCCDILDRPDKKYGKIIDSACDGKVRIISKANEEFYKVDYKSKIGYLNERWIIK